MIAGIGVDVVTLSRISNTHERFGERFARRILSDEEMIEYAVSKTPERFLAKRFAVKEAAVKALGTGERVGVLLKDFSLTHDKLGKPGLHITDKAALRCQHDGIIFSHVSLSDEGDTVVAFVVLERNSQSG
ncbi:MAG: holo-ACP synthase [Granulosicoccus sp.]